MAPARRPSTARATMRSMGGGVRSSGSVGMRQRASSGGQCGAAGIPSHDSPSLSTASPHDRRCDDASGRDRPCATPRSRSSLRTKRAGRMPRVRGGYGSVTTHVRASGSSDASRSRICSENVAARGRRYPSFRSSDFPRNEGVPGSSPGVGFVGFAGLSSTRAKAAGCPRVRGGTSWCLFTVGEGVARSGDRLGALQLVRLSPTMPARDESSITSSSSPSTQVTWPGGCRTPGWAR